jgi:hypothetical protein
MMGYNIIDVVDKAINIANRKKAIYEDISKNNSNNPSIKMLSKVLIKEVDQTIKYYETYKKEVGSVEFEEIDFGVYDKMSFLINEFNKKIYIPEIHNNKSFLSFSLNLEKGIYALLIDLQGRFVQNTSDLHTKTYEILSDMIKNKVKHIDTLEKTLK